MISQIQFTRLARAIAILCASVFALAAVRLFAQTPPKACTVLQVKDGDTLKLHCESGDVNVRLYGIDAPEKKMKFGFESRAALFKLAPVDSQVYLEVINTDMYGRSVGVVYACQKTQPDCTAVNYQMVKDGWAWSYRAYHKDKKLNDLEDEAKKAHKGLWQDSSPVAPWVWRKQQKAK